jgi:hypothetical protein
LEVFSLAVAAEVLEAAVAVVAAVLEDSLAVVAEEDFQAAVVALPVAEGLLGVGRSIA